jgi:predicted membrane channel-forming protein YqfA (hemolysin III family)
MLQKYFALMFFWYGIGFGFFASRIPEKLAPNNFYLTILFSSHTLWHICVLNAIYVWFFFLIHYRELLLIHECTAYTISLHQQQQTILSE